MIKRKRVGPMLAITLTAAALLAVVVMLRGESGRMADGVERVAELLRRPEWTLQASVIEACSCPLFCPSYFTDRPAWHAATEGHAGAAHFCRFNRAYRVNDGEYRGVPLDGAQFWLAGDLGSEIDDGEAQWAVLTFDRATTQAQRDAIAVIVRHLFPLRWKSFAIAEGDIAWDDQTSRMRLSSRRFDVARATLDGGRTAEVSLVRPRVADDPSQSTVIEGLRYFGAAKNGGFVLMSSKLQAWRSGDQRFESQGTSGFTLTLQIDSKTAPPAPTGP